MTRVSANKVTFHPLLVATTLQLVLAGPVVDCWSRCGNFAHVGRCGMKPADRMALVNSDVVSAGVLETSQQRTF